jgi:hypothetical protein
LASLRDSVSFFRFASQDGVGTPNPMAGAIDRAVIFGVFFGGR